MKRYLRLIAILLFPLLGNLAVSGQAVATLENDEMLMGTVMKLTVSVPLKTDSTKVAFPLLEEARKKGDKYVALLNDTVELRTDHTLSQEVREGKSWLKYNLLIQSFDSGRYTLPYFEFLAEGDTIRSNRLTLSVIPVKVKADDKIDGFSDIAQPFEIIPNPEELEEDTSSAWIWWLVGAAVLLLAIIIYLYIRFRRTGTLSPFAKPVPIYQQALKKLDKLEKQNLPAKGKTKEYYTRISDILRKYLNKQFGIKTLEKTTAEILHSVDNSEQVAAYGDTLKSVLETSDFVKFAKVTPSEVENSRCMQESRRFIIASHPHEEVKNEKKKEGGKK